MRLSSGLLRTGKPLRLNLNIHMDQRNRRRRYAWNARSVAQRSRAHALKLFVHLAREAADFAIVEPFGDYALLGFLEPLDRLALLVEIAGVFDFGLDGLHLIARGGGEHAGVTQVN